MKLLLASGNAKKLAELQRIAAPLGVEVVSPRDVGSLPEVEEDGATFLANAAKKASSGARASGLWTLADDSGLCVDALDGAPGIFSARYAGTHGDDAGNNAKLLDALADVPDGDRGARFVCALALARPGSGEIAHEVEGRVEGEILREAQGEGGFGYDPLFAFAESGSELAGRSFAELSPEQKASIGHRGRAVQALAAALPDLLDRLGS